MDINKPIPFFVRWQYSRAGSFIRRNSWFFYGRRLRFIPPYIILFIVVPTGAAILSRNSSLATIVGILSLTHLAAWFILVSTAVSKPPANE